MKAPYTKPFLPIPDQIQRLKSRGMSIPDEDSAARYLSNIGYYRLSGYWFPFRTSQIALGTDGRPTMNVHDQFRESVSFEHVVGLYAFDRHLRVLIMDILERIEIALRTKLALQLGQKDPWAHLKKEFLDAKFCTEIPSDKDTDRHSEFVASLQKKVASSREEFVSHHIERYDEDLPIWVAVEVMDFGAVSMLLSSLKYGDKRDVAKSLGVRPELLPSWIRSLAFVRNVCAHHGRLWNRSIIAQPRPPKAGEIPELDHLVEDSFARERLYGALAVARHLQKQIIPDSVWGTRLHDLSKTFPVAPGIALGQAGFPTNWSLLPLWTD